MRVRLTFHMVISPRWTLTRFGIPALRRAVLISLTSKIPKKNPEADHLLEQARQEFDPEKRKQLYWRWQEIINDEQPVTFLYYQEESAAYSKRFQNVQWLPLRPGYDLNNWWVPKGLQKYKSSATP